jgi:hypothetical protein
MEGGKKEQRELTNDVGHGLPAAVLLLGLGAALVIGGHQLVVLLLGAILLPLLLRRRRWLLMLPIAAAGISCFHDGWMGGWVGSTRWLNLYGDRSDIQITRREEHRHLATTS